MWERPYRALWVVQAFCLPYTQTFKVGKTMQEFQKKTEKSLYEGLGGYDVIAMVVNDYTSAIHTDPQFSHFSSSHSTDSKNHAIEY